MISQCEATKAASYVIAHGIARKIVVLWVLYTYTLMSQTMSCMHVAVRVLHSSAFVMTVYSAGIVTVPELCSGTGYVAIVTRYTVSYSIQTLICTSHVCM